MKATGLAEADANKARGLAQAEVIEAQGKATAEAMRVKAESFKQYNEAAVIEMIVRIMPEIAGKISEPLAKMEKMVIINNQPGDWIEVDGRYGEVKAIGMRAVRIVTADDDDVIVPHSKIWTNSISNASSGSHNLTCVANFYLQPDHDGGAVRQALAEVAENSTYRKPRVSSPVVVGVSELPWGADTR